MRVGTSAIVAALIVVGCSSGDGDSASSEPSSEASATSVAEADGLTEVNEGDDSGFSVNDEPDRASGEVEQVPPDEVVTEGSPPPTFVYTEEIEPAETLAATLCNLNSEFLRSLRSEDASGSPIADDDLRIAILSLGDSLSLWRDLELSFPDTAEDLARADRVLELWDEALLARENGQDGDAKEFIQLAEDVIDELPELPPEGIDACES